MNYINDVVTPACSKINPPSPDGTSEVLKVIDQLEEKVCYGEMTAAEAAKQLFEEGNKILVDQSQYERLKEIISKIVTLE